MRKLNKKEIEGIRRDPSKQDWFSLSYRYKLSEDFIREFKDYVNWYYLSEHQKLSESLIRDFQDKVWWIIISRYQDLSEVFLLEFIDRLNLDWIKHNKQIPKQLKNKIIMIKEMRDQ